MDRLNTKEMLQIRNYNVQPNNLCVICEDHMLETSIHLLFDCPFALDCWQKLGFVWTFSPDIHIRLQQGRQIMGIPFFMGIFIIAVWEIWNVRNSNIFEGNLVSMQLWTVRFKAQVLLQLHRVREDLRTLVVQWLDSIL